MNNNDENNDHLKLTAKQAKFAVEYIKTGNATDSYRKAYETSNMKQETVWRKAIEVLQNGKVAAKISYLQSKIDKEEVYSLDKVLNEFGEIAFSNIIDIFDFVIDEDDKNKIILIGGAKKLSELPRKITGCIQSLKQTKDGSIEVKLYSKDNSLSQIARMKGYYAPDKLLIGETTLADLLKQPNDE